MTPLQKIKAEMRARERFMQELYRIDSCDIKQEMPPIPEYKVVKIPFTRVVREAFSKNIYKEFINLTKI